MAVIKVDVVRLEDLSRELNLLRHEFESIEDRVGDHQEASGARGRLSDALEDLSANWSEKRGEVVAALESFAGLALDAARHYRQLDEALAANFEGSTSGASG